MRIIGAGDVIIRSTTDSSSSTTGALQVAGGGYIGNTMNVGNRVVINGGSSIGRLSIGGPNASGSGPHISLTTNADAYPQMQLFSYAHNDVHLLFDCHFSYNWFSSSNTGNFAISKQSGLATFNYSNGVAAGSAVNLSTAMSINLTNGTVSVLPATVSNSTTSGALQVIGGVGVGGSLYAGNMFIGTNAVATQAYVTGLGYITSSALTPYLTTSSAASTYLTSSTAASTYLTSSSASSTYQPIITAGTGLTKTGNTLSVNAAQTQITSVGTLTSLTTSGIITVSTFGTVLGTTYLTIGDATPTARWQLSTGSSRLNFLQYDGTTWQNRGFFEMVVDLW